VTEIPQITYWGDPCSERSVDDQTGTQLLSTGFCAQNPLRPQEPAATAINTLWEHYSQEELCLKA
jgi:hypothetical protein